jgi:hypothetical protein
MCFVTFTSKPVRACIFCDLIEDVRQGVEDVGTAAGDAVRGTARAITSPIDPLIEDCGGDICGSLKDGRKKLTGEDKVDRAKKEQEKVNAELNQLRAEWQKVKQQLDLKNERLSKIKSNAINLNSLIKQNVFLMNSRIDGQLENLHFIKERLNEKKGKYIQLQELYRNQEFEKFNYVAYHLSLTVNNVLSVIVKDDYFAETEPIVQAYRLNSNKYSFLHPDNDALFLGVEDSLENDKVRIQSSLKALESQILETENQISALTEIKLKNEEILNRKFEVN